jgi:hypothetical protein
VLLIGFGILLALAVAHDLARRIALQQRMRVDRHALRAYLEPRTIDPHLIDITVHGPQDLVCLPTGDHHGPPRHICIEVVHTPAGTWRVISRRPRS